MLADILKVAGPAIVAILGSLLSYALLKLSAFLHSKAEGSKIFNALAVAEDFVNTAVTHAKEQLEPEIKAALADGTISAEERAKILADALDLIKKELPSAVGDVLTNVLGPGLETWLSGKVAGAVTPH